MLKKNRHLLSLVIFSSPVALAGNLNPPAGPNDPASAMYNTQDICNRLDSGAAGSKQAFTEPTSGPANSSRCTLNDIMDKSPAVDNTNGATPANVLTGKIYWGLTSGHWGPQTGTLTTQTLNNTTVNQPAGNYQTFNLSVIDTDLTASNIKSGIAIFGVTGTYTGIGGNVQDTTSGDAVAADILSGKKAWVDGGELTGTLATRTPDNTTVSQLAGNYNAFNLSTVDTDLTAGNVKSGITLFGVTGTYTGIGGNVQDTTSGDAVAAEILSGKKAWVDGSELTGTLATRTPDNTTVSQLAGNYNAFNLSTVDTDLTAGNVKSGITLFGVTGTYTGIGGNVQDTSSGNALASEILSGKKAWVDGSELTGTLATRTPDNTTVNQPAGNYQAFDLSVIDTDLTASNIKSGVTLFGIEGTHAGGGGSTAVPETGQKKCYNQSGTEISCNNTGQDGDKQKGVAWPTPRFTANVDNNNNGDCDDSGETCDGTVTDNLTGLIWLKNANCANAKRNWATALSDVDQLNTNGKINSNNCGDTSNSGSHQTDWRLPNFKELHSLIDASEYGPALPDGHPFSGVQTSYYWSSTTRADNASNAWNVYLNSGNVYSNDKTNSYYYVWPVRGGK